MSDDKKRTDDNSSGSGSGTAGNGRTLTGSQDVDSLATVSRIAVRIPPFWHEKPEIWFAQIEAQFEIARINRDSSKFNTVVSAIESKVLTQISDAVLSPPASDKYENLKKAIIEQFGDSDQRKIKKLLSEVDLGDKRPSQLLNELRSLAGTQINADFLKSLWLQRLPAQVRAILQASSQELTALAKLADKVMEVGDFKNIMAVNSPQQRTEPPSTTTAELSLHHQIQQISCQLNELMRQTKGIQTHRSRSRSRSRFPNSHRRRSQANEDYCWFHQQFGVKARNCREPCSFKSSTSKN